MYWVTESGIDNNNNPYLEYNFFQIVHVINAKKAEYNPVTRVTKYPILKEIVVRAYVAVSEEDFLEYYHLTPRL